MPKRSEDYQEEHGGPAEKRPQWGAAPGFPSGRMCLYCDAGPFPTIDLLEQHAVEAHQLGPKGYKCESCPRTYKTLRGKNRHAELKHDNHPGL